MRDKMNKKDRQHHRDIYKGPKFESGYGAKNMGWKGKVPWSRID